MSLPKGQSHFGLRTGCLWKVVGFEVGQRKRIVMLIPSSAYTEGRCVRESLPTCVSVAGLQSACLALLLQCACVMGRSWGHCVGWFSFLPLRGSAVNLVRSGSYTRQLRGDEAKGSETPQTAAPSTYVSTYLKRYQVPQAGGGPHLAMGCGS